MPDEVHSSASQTGKPKLTPFDRRAMQRDLAAKELTRAKIARKYGVSTSYVSQFAKQYAKEIDVIRADLDNAFAGFWIASKEFRIQALEAEYARALGSDKRDHHEWIKARLQILHQASEELGQLPPRATVAVTPVVHILEGVDVSLLE